MRRNASFASFAAASVALVACALSRPASADSMDPALARLVTDASCRAVGPNGTGRYFNPVSATGTRCAVDNQAFAGLVARYGAAFAPNAMHTARTTGYGGFEIALEGTFTSIDSGASYWKNGTQGPDDPSTKRSSIVNASPDGMLQVYGIKFRKGLPLGFELQGNVGYMAHTSMFVAGGDVRWSLLEGFRHGVPGILPDVMVGGGVRTVAGTETMKLTIASFEGTFSKPIPIGGTVVVTPYVGYQFLRIFGDSGLVDLTPNTDAVNYCGYTGPNTPANPDPNTKIRDGQPVCRYGSASDFNNTVVFDSVRLTRHRIDFGAQVRVQMFRAGVHVATDLVDLADANKNSTHEVADPTNPGNTKTTNDFANVGKQVAIGVDLAAVF